MITGASSPLLRVDSLQVRFGSGKDAVTAVDNASFNIAPGEVFGLVGESGSGKSATCRSLIRLYGGSIASLPKGSITFNGRDLVRLSDKELTEIRGAEIAMIFQDPMSALNPTMRIGDQIGESLRRHQNLSSRAARERALHLLRSVGVTAPERRLDNYPHHFSGGMRQRVLIALALACRPKLLIADEPTTALDVTVQQQILRLILDLRQQTNLAVLLVTHDLGVVAQTCDRVAVMYAGRIVETGTTRQIFRRPAHPYTRALLNALPSSAGRKDTLAPIEGEPPSLAAPPSGCRFHPRCPLAVDACKQAEHVLRAVEPGHESACIRVGELGC
ncbi:ABC transporter ATP-binding protein [Microvirga rosea]|uniref:ABC transporter ATP-binding protein n=1 Tax=Microvirga rosea TaxID=2715425 RepID=UPI001D0BAF40|nr:ABC transporter ATP-binding protein [Microvirga rosea]MCB8822487.1 ABC transporter ATP-binding protein [Microvirga rosea]